jgi:hypothetical protein
VDGKLGGRRDEIMRERRKFKREIEGLIGTIRY